MFCLLLADKYTILFRSARNVQNIVLMVYLQNYIVYNINMFNEEATVLLPFFTNPYL